jgi:hypothetical protein
MSGKSVVSCRANRTCRESLTCRVEVVSSESKTYRAESNMSSMSGESEMSCRANQTCLVERATVGRASESNVSSVSSKSCVERVESSKSKFKSNSK